MICLRNNRDRDKKWNDFDRPVRGDPRGGGSNTPQGMRNSYPDSRSMYTDNARDRWSTGADR